MPASEKDPEMSDDNLFETALHRSYGYPFNVIASLPDANEYE